MARSRSAQTDEVGVLAPLLHRLGLPESLISPLLAHARAVEAGAVRLGLVSPNDADHVVARHTGDSLLFALARGPQAGERWVDVGSGAGFPGLVLACCYPETAFTLVEPLKRRAGFLELQAATLGLANLVVEPKRLEEAPDGFDVAVARALSHPAQALPTLLKLVVPGGIALVAAGAGAAVPPGATAVLPDGIESVDSPGLLFMMSRE